MGHIKTTVYHPQANGQMKRTNQEIKRYLRKYVIHHQDNWTQLLTMLEYAYNTKRSERYTFTPFQIIYEKTPKIIAKKIMKEIQLEERRNDELEETERIFRI